MAYSFSREQNQKLNALHSRVRFKHRSNTAGDYVRAVLIDQYTKREWVFADAPGTGEKAEKDALDAVLAKAQPGERPLTPAEAAAKLRAYRERFGELDAAAADAPPHPVTTPAGDDQLSAAEITQALRSAGLAIPEGDKRTGEWREKALSLLKSIAANN